MMREYIKNPHYNDWKNEWDEKQRKTLLIIKCPYCEKDTSYSPGSWLEPIDIETKQRITCEECDRSFYTTLSVSVEKIY